MPPGADALAHARALLNTLRTLAAQHEQVLAAYERQLDVITSGGAAKLSKAPANKRPPPLPSEPEGPEAKKARLQAEQQQRRNLLWHECYKVLDRCRRNQKAEAFKKPVDPIKMKIPDYPLVVKNPMDLQTVGEKLKLRVYKDPGEFAADMRLIWDNAQLYNGRNHPVGLAAIAMSEFFEKAWGPAQIEKQWAIQLQQEELAEKALEGNLDALPNSDLPRQLKEKRDLLGHLIGAKDFTEGLPPGALGPCEPGRAMGFEEKRKLSAHLASLPGEKMERVVDIVEAGLPPNPDADPTAEMELDIDALPDAVLWQLKEYVDSVLAPPSAPPKKGGASKGGPASKAPNKAAPNKGAAAASAAPVAAAAGSGAPSGGPATPGLGGQASVPGSVGGVAGASGAGTPAAAGTPGAGTPAAGTPPPPTKGPPTKGPPTKGPPQQQQQEPPSKGQHQPEQQQQQQQPEAVAPAGGDASALVKTEAEQAAGDAPAPAAAAAPSDGVAAPPPAADGPAAATAPAAEVKEEAAGEPAAAAPAPPAAAPSPAPAGEASDAVMAAPSGSEPPASASAPPPERPSASDGAAAAPDGGATAGAASAPVSEVPGSEAVAAEDTDMAAATEPSAGADAPSAGGVTAPDAPDGGDEAAAGADGVAEADGSAEPMEQDAAAA